MQIITIQLTTEFTSTPMPDMFPTTEAEIAKNERETSASTSIKKY